MAMAWKLGCGRLKFCGDQLFKATMQRGSPDGVHWDKEGCYVFRVVSSSGVCVRSKPEVGDEVKTSSTFCVGNLVPIDSIRHSRMPGSKNGPFLRLSDGTGWLFEFKHGARVMERVTVQQELYQFYGDNIPTGIALRRHPIDSQDLKVSPKTMVLPLQKVWCDAKVVNDVIGITFYRVQGTAAWIFDRRGTKTMLLPTSKVAKGLFAYRANVNVAIRSKPGIGDDLMTSRTVRKGELCAANALRYQSEDGPDNGPFLRLTDGSGWLFVAKRGEVKLEEVFVARGEWRFQVENVFGIPLLPQPIDNDLSIHDTVFQKGESVVCDAKVACEATGVNFFRVKSTDGWVFDKRGTHQMLKPSECNSSFSDNDGWSIDFVRGVALAFSANIRETGINHHSRVISFLNRADSVRIDVHYGAKAFQTSTTSSENKSQFFHRNCTEAELLEILRSPKVPLRLACDEGDTMEGEEELRSKLLKCQEDLSRLMDRKISLCQSIKTLYDDRRAEETEAMFCKEKQHKEMMRMEEEAEKRE